MATGQHVLFSSRLSAAFLPPGLVGESAEEAAQPAGRLHVLPTLAALFVFAGAGGFEGGEDAGGPPSPTHGGRNPGHSSRRRRAGAGSGRLDGLLALLTRLRPAAGRLVDFLRHGEHESPVAFPGGVDDRIGRGIGRGRVRVRHRKSRHDRVGGAGDGSGRTAGIRLGRVRL